MEDSSNSVTMEQEAIVSRFASLMASETFKSGEGAGRSSSAEQNDLLNCFADSLSDDTVVCTLPSLDVKVSEVGGALPEVGQSMEKVGQSMETDSNHDSGLQPIMEASVLGSAADASADVAKMEQKAAQRLCNTSTWTKASIGDASSALLKNVTDSFSSLVDSRVKSWTLLMFRHSLSSGDSSSRTNLLKVLAASIKISSSKSCFKTLPLPPGISTQTKEADVILPLIFEVEFNISLGEKTESVTLRAPGTISGNFAPERPKGLAKVDIRLDSGALLGSMVDKARLIVFKTVANVTSTDLQAKQAEPEAKPSASAAAAPMVGLSGGFSSSLRLTTTQATNSPRLAKARSSALRLNSVLQGTTGGKADNAHGIRKNRSVQWDHPMEMPSMKGSAPPSSKKPKIAVPNTNRMKSFKSFGRPHADDSESGPRNATFGNFGRKPIWGKDGRLANHPTPENALQRNQDIAELGVKVTGSVNATFGTPSSASRPTGNASSRSGARLPNSLPRTATALESWLLNAAGGNAS